MDNARVLATGLRFPEAPVWMADGSIILVEIERQCITRVAADGTVSVVATTGGGPNGLAIGPDGALYCCNNGGFLWREDRAICAPPAPHPTTSPGASSASTPRPAPSASSMTAAASTSCLVRTTSCSTIWAASTSPISARPGRATATGAASTTHCPTARRSSRWRTRSSRRTASASRPTTRCCTSPRPKPAGSGRATSLHPASSGKRPSRPRMAAA